jgi:hypothetical protein
VNRFASWRPSPATIISLVALFVALGGTGYAAVALAPKNSVNSASVINGSLQKADLSEKAVEDLNGDRGARGAAGPPGPQGAQGDRGREGPAIKTHVRSVGAVTTGAKDELVLWQLTGASWTQKAGEIDLFYGMFTVTPPAACSGQAGGPPGAGGYGIVTVQLDGVDIGSTYVPHGISGQVIELRPYLFGQSSGGAVLAPAVDTTHVLTAMVKDTCEGTNENVTFNSLAIDVISVS